jgi:stage II sporulation protein GA (sporulation sigma-E factor processing peptidase)
MIIVTFTPDKFRDFFKLISIFYIISLAFGGAAFFLFYITGSGIIANGTFYIRDFPLSLLISAFALCYILLVYCWDYIQSRILKNQLKYNIVIEIDGKSAGIDAIIDTGNSLKDPISNLPVIVVEYEVLKDLLPRRLSQMFRDSGGNVDYERLCSIMDNADWIYRVRLIPFSSLGKQNGMLVGVKPDKVRINHSKFSREISNVIVGIYNNKISKDGDYKALLYPEILK